jgi:eukaryotic-like serine/threonine-protein kinase
MPNPSDRSKRSSDHRRNDDPPEDPSTSSRLDRPPTRRAALETDTLVAGRYHVVRMIGRGGMSEVYEVEDQSLRGIVVALKIILPEVAAKPGAVDRFKREIYLARRVTHPNVCRIYDLGSHRPTEGSDETLFLTMEFLDGETLADRIDRQRVFDPAEALPILSQIAAGLDAAHAQGIIHRDFKSGNVMLMSVESARSPKTRAVVTDFGLASVADDAQLTLTSISDAGKIVGTPAFMAPEQVEGLPLTTKADLYAFGIVMYHMVTGRRPFEGSSPMAVATKRITQAPDPPRKHVPNLDPLWDAAILRCLERDPAARFATAGDVISALTRPEGGIGGDVETASHAQLTATMDVTASRPRRPRRVLLVSLATAGIAASATLAYRSLPDRRAVDASGGSTAVTTAAARPAVAILGFRDLTMDREVDWLGTAMAEMLARHLAAGGNLRTIPAHEIARVERDLGLSNASDLSRDALSRLRANLGSEFAVSGGYLRQEGLLRADLRLIDLARGETVATGTAHGSEAQLFDVLARAAEPLCNRLGIGSPLRTAQAALDVRASLPSKAEAASAYAEGLARWRVLDVLGARKALEAAIAADPTHPLPHSALSAVWSALGYEAKARDEAQSARDLSTGLSAEDKLAIKARLAEVSKDWASAIADYESLVRLAPDDPEYALDLASVQTRSGRAREALLTLESLRRVSGKLPADPRIDLASALAFQELGDLQRQRAFAAQAATAAAARGARSITARARLIEAAAVAATGDSDRATELAEDARQLFESTGDRAGTARAVERLGLTLYTSGELEGARKLFARSLVVYREVGDRGSEARVLHNSGNILLAQGHLSEAQAAFDQSLATFRQIGAKYETAAALNDIGARLQNAGDLPAARKRYEDALTAFGEIGEKKGIATTLTNMAEVLYIQGDLKRAQDLHEEALATCREIGERDIAGYNLYRLGEVFAAKGDLNVAKQKYEEALKLQGQLGDKMAMAQTQLGLAGLARAQGRVVDAESLGRQAEEVLRAGNAADLATMAQSFLAEMLLDQGKRGEAQKMASAAAAAKTEDRHVRLTTARLVARLRASSGKPEDVVAALRGLEKNRAEALAAGFVADGYEATLALADVEMRAGRGAAARTRLEDLIRQADGRGFGLAARRASRVLEGHE